MKRIIFAGIIVLVLLSAGCIKKTPAGPYAPDYYKGTEGLKMSIIRNLPPAEVWKGNAFVIAVELRNAGAYDIEDAQVSINYDPTYLDIIEPQRTVSLKGKQDGYPEGETEILNFEVEDARIRPGSEEQISSFTVRAYYNYETKISAEVCINPDVYNTAKTSYICEMDSLAFSGGQGAPVAVTRIDQTISPYKLEYKVSYLVHIANKDKGEVLDNKVIVKEAKLSSMNLECAKEVFLTEDGNSLIECSALLSDIRGAYITPVTFTMEYGYESFVDQKLTIVDLLLKAKKI